MARSSCRKHYYFAALALDLRFLRAAHRAAKPPLLCSLLILYQYYIRDILFTHVISSSFSLFSRSLYALYSMAFTANAAFGDGCRCGLSFGTIYFIHEYSIFSLSTRFSLRDTYRLVPSIFPVIKLFRFAIWYLLLLKLLFSFFDSWYIRHFLTSISHNFFLYIN